MKDKKKEKKISIFKYLKPYKILIIVAVSLIAMQVVGDLYLPNLMSDIINNGVAKVEYSVNDDKLVEAIQNNEIPEFTAYLQENNITPQMLQNEEVQNTLRENLLTASDSADYTSLEPEQLAMFQSMMVKGIIESKSVADVQYILKIGGIMLLVSLGSTIVTVIATYLSSKVAMGFGAKIRAGVFRKVESFSSGNMNKFGAATLINRTTNDVNQIQQATIMILRMMVAAPLTAVGGVIMILREDASLSWIVAVVVPILLVIMLIVMAKSMPLFKKLQKKLDEVNKVIREQLTGIRVIRAFDKIDYEKERFDKANLEHIDVAIKVNRIMAIVIPVVMFTIFSTNVGIMWFGAHRIEEGAMQIGNLMAFIQYTMQILFSFMMAAMLFVLLPRASASAERLNEVLREEPLIKDLTKNIPEANKETASVEFRNMSFTYPDGEGDALYDISFTAGPGKTTAIIGSTGSGKSTIISLVERFFDVTKGEILLNNINIKDMPMHELRKNVGYVSQKAVLFSGTIRDNMKYGREDATDEEIMKALEVAQAKDFVLEQGGLDYIISQGGANLSGGQKQRLSIARALVRKPNVYVFDDSFSALDFKTDSRLRAALRRETTNSTFIIVAQRVSTIMDADQIIVLENGRIVGDGTHKELLQNCEVYKEIVYSQVSEEEIA